MSCGLARKGVLAHMQTGFLKLDPNGKIVTGLTWMVAIIAATYLGWLGFSLYRATAAFNDLYDSLNANLGGRAGFFIHNYRWICPLVFGGAAILVCAKEFFLRQNWLRLMITIGTASALGELANGLAFLLYSPAFDQIQKLK